MRTVTCPHLTLYLGATTKAGALTSPLRERFGLVYRLDFYTAEELETIVITELGRPEKNVPHRTRRRLPKSASAKRNRRTPRIKQPEFHQAGQGLRYEVRSPVCRHYHTRIRHTGSPALAGHWTTRESSTRMDRRRIPVDASSTMIALATCWPGSEAPMHLATDGPRPRKSERSRNNVYEPAEIDSSRPCYLDRVRPRDSPTRRRGNAD